MVTMLQVMSLVMVANLELSSYLVVRAQRFQVILLFQFLDIMDKRYTSPRRDGLAWNLEGELSANRTGPRKMG